MVRVAPPSPSASADEALHEIDRLLDELLQLSHSATESRSFHGEVLSRAVRALAAVAGAFWVPDPAQGLRLDSSIDPAGLSLIEQLRKTVAHRELLETTLRDGQPRLVLPGERAPGEASAANPTDFLLLVCPIVVESAPSGIGMIEIVQRAGDSPATEQSYLRLLAAFCDVAADFHRRRLIELWQERAARVREIEQFSSNAHASLEVDVTAVAVANEARRLIQCDRVTVARLRQSESRVLAISGQAEIDRRATTGRSLEALISAVAAAGKPLWHGPDRQALAPQVSVPLEAYLDLAHPQVLAVIPLSRQEAAGESGPSQAPAAILVESFEAREFSEPVRERIEIVSQIGGQALRNAIEYESVPLYPLWKLGRKLTSLTESRQLPRTLIGLGLLVVAGLGVAFVPAELEISGRGTLQPAIRREVFAAADGVVSEVRAEHGDSCRTGEPLVTLTRSQLDFELSRVLGEMQTAGKRLAGVTAARLDATPRTASDRDRSNQLAADEEELKALLANLEEQLTVLRRQQEELIVRSPIDGQVITWNARELLEGRPVQKGQALLTVSDLEGPWVVEVEVPDDQIGHVLAARASIRKDLDVNFLLATAPGTTYHGRVESVSMTTDARPSEPAHVLVTVAFDRESVTQLRPGATVVPRIRCGQRSMGYVWFHGLIEALQKNFWF